MIEFTVSRTLEHFSLPKSQLTTTIHLHMGILLKDSINKVGHGKRLVRTGGGGRSFYPINETPESKIKHEQQPAKYSLLRLSDAKYLMHTLHIKYWKEVVYVAISKAVGYSDIKEL